MAPLSCPGSGAVISRTSIHFDTQRIVLFGRGLRYDPYYFAIAGEDRDKQFGEVVKEVLHQWALALEQGKDNDRTLFLPFGIYDQCTECLAASILGEQVQTRCVWLDVEGWRIDLLNLTEFIRQGHSTVRESPELFGIFNHMELVDALRHPMQASI